VNHIALAEKELSQIGAVLSGYSSNQSYFGQVGVCDPEVLM
jgi:hypothetical protein